MQFLLTALLGSGWVIAVDALGGWLAVKGKVEPALWLPVSVLAHVAFGAVTTILVPSVPVFRAGLIVGVIDGTLGTLILSRIGAFGDDTELMKRWVPFLLPITVPLLAGAAWWGSWLVR